MQWRNVSFVDHIDLQFNGNVLPQAIHLGDVDNDGDNELVVGNIEGDLGIFKGASTVPSLRATGLGMIVCLRIGNIFNVGKNYLVVLNSEGHCHIFDVKTDGVKRPEDLHAPVEGRVLYPAHTERLPANGKAMLIADVEADGLVEMVVTYADRQVRMFRWQMSGEAQTFTNLPYPGHLKQLDKWQLAGQIGAVTLDRSAEGKPELLVSQPGRTYCILHPTSQVPVDKETKLSTLTFQPLGQARVRNKEITTVIVGGIRRGEGSPSTYSALASLDGSLMLVENEKILWSLQVEHKLCAIDKLDLTGNGQEEVVCCSWNGQTYIVNHSREVVRFHFNGNINAFAAGYYSVPGKGNVPCFVYTEFGNDLYIYHGITLPCIESSSLLHTMSKRDTTQPLLDRLGIDSSKTDEIRSLYRWLLYGKPVK